MLSKVILLSACELWLGTQCCLHLKFGERGTGFQSHPVLFRCSVPVCLAIVASTPVIKLPQVFSFFPAVGHSISLPALFCVFLVAPSYLFLFSKPYSMFPLLLFLLTAICFCCSFPSPFNFLFNPFIRGVFKAFSKPDLCFAFKGIILYKEELMIMQYTTANVKANIIVLMFINVCFTRFKLSYK